MPSLFSKLAFILAASVVAKLVTAYPPTCNEFYGHPDAGDCQSILINRFHRPTARANLGVVITDTDHHAFAIAGMQQRPASISDTQWSKKVDIPKFWGPSQYPNCKVALLPILRATGPSYDTGRYAAISAVGQSIRHYCVEASGIPGLTGTGGIEIAGDNNQLRVVLYAPKSKFENKTIDDYKAGFPIGIVENEQSSDVSTQTPAPKPRVRLPQAPSSEDFAFLGRRYRTRNFGSGWMLDFDEFHPLEPDPKIIAQLKGLYGGISDNAVQQLSTGGPPSKNLAFKLGKVSLQLESTDVISWSWIIDFAQKMVDEVSGGFDNFFKGDIYSTFWDLATVSVAIAAIA